MWSEEEEGFGGACLEGLLVEETDALGEEEGVGFDFAEHLIHLWGESCLGHVHYHIHEA